MYPQQMFNLSPVIFKPQNITERHTANIHSDCPDISDKATNIDSIDGLQNIFSNHTYCTHAHEKHNTPSQHEESQLPNNSSQSTHRHKGKEHVHNNTTMHDHSYSCNSHSVLKDKCTNRQKDHSHPYQSSNTKRNIHTQVQHNHTYFKSTHNMNVNTFQSESTAFLGALSAQCAESAPRKAVD